MASCSAVRGPEIGITTPARQPPKGKMLAAAETGPRRAAMRTQRYWNDLRMEAEGTFGLHDLL
ncbi:MAG: hypothetical protein DI605_00360 [Sphingomonas sp.]|nr:MAG: hypothetical protein DI605_00360 [Sphingomonas sp.]